MLPWRNSATPEMRPGMYQISNIAYSCCSCVYVCTQNAKAAVEPFVSLRGVFFLRGNDRKMETLEIFRFNGPL